MNYNILLKTEDLLPNHDRKRDKYINPFFLISLNSRSKEGYIIQYFINKQKNWEKSKIWVDVYTSGRIYIFVFSYLYMSAGLEV